MIRIIKKILFFVLILFSFFLVSKVQANTLNKIDMDIYIDENGNASVTEVWQVNLTEGSEGFRSITNLGNSSISNFSVSDDFGRTYDTLSNWNTGATFENKAYKCGIHTIPSGVELCWGISNYGNRTYTLNYTINNLVTQYTDTQGIYFNFLNLDQEISDNTKIVIHSNIPFSLDNAKIWSFGNNGSINFDNGNIVIDSGGRLLANQYIVGLIKFESNLFNTNSNSSISFDDIYNSAFGINDNESEFNWISLLGYILLFILIALLLGVIIYLVIVIGTPLFILVMAIFEDKRDKSQFKDDFYFGKKGLVLPKNRKIAYCREIPCNKDLERAYWVCYYFDILPITTLYEGIIGSILLKWIKNDYITVIKTKDRFS